MALFVLAACNQQKEEEGSEKSSVTESKENDQLNKESVASKNEQKPDDQNTTNQEGLKENPPSDTVYENEVFKDVVVSESENELIITGKAQVFEGVFQYALYDGNKVLVEKNYQTDGAPAWGEFKITFKKELASTNKTKVELFVYSAKDGSKVNTLEIPISKQ